MLVVTKQVKDVDRKWWNVSSHFFPTRDALNVYLMDERKDAGLRKTDRMMGHDGTKLRYVVKEVQVVSTWTVTM